MSPLPDWRLILRRAWSVRLILLAGLLSGLEVALPWIAAGWAPPGLFAALTLVVTGGALVARLIAQRTLGTFWEDDRGAVTRRGAGLLTATAAGAAAVAAFVAPHEGLRTEAYLDPVGIPTICFGETRGVSMSDRATPAECEAQLARAVGEFEAGIAGCVEGWSELPDRTRIALISWTYNVGIGAACRSTLVRKLEAGDLDGACAELPRWNKAGGRVLPGLVNRREAERQLCLAGLRDPVAPPVRPPAFAEELPSASAPPDLRPSGELIAVAALLALIAGALMLRRRA